MKKLAYSILFTLLTSGSFAQTRTDFDNAVGKFQRFFNAEQGDSIYNLLSDHDKSIMPEVKAKESFLALHKQVGNLKSFMFETEKDKVAIYKSTFDNIVFELSVSLTPDNKLEVFHFAPYKTEATPGKEGTPSQSTNSNFSMKAGSGTIYGTITVPDGNKKSPVVLIISGSGPTDRDCNNALGANTNAFKMLADSLKAAGIASLRYDKRGVGESAPALNDQKSARFEDYIADAVGCIKALKADSRFSDVYVLGHSEGSLIGIVAAETEPIAGLISLSGAGESVDKLIVKQLYEQSESIGEKTRILADSLKMGYTLKHVPAELATVFDISVQNYMRSWMEYDPRVEIKKLKIPVIIIQGTTDIQIGTKDAELLKKAYPKAKLVLVKGMNHVLKQAPADHEKNIETYGNPDLPLSGDFVPHIVQFVMTKKS